eukprot:3641834-Rhodomonas_salina.1
MGKAERGEEEGRRSAAPGFPCGSLGCKVRLWPEAGCGTRLSVRKSGVQSPSLARGLRRHPAIRGEAWGAKSGLASSLAGRHRAAWRSGCMLVNPVVLTSTVGREASVRILLQELGGEYRGTNRDSRVRYAIVAVR